MTTVSKAEQGRDPGLVAELHAVLALLSSRKLAKRAEAAGADDAALEAKHHCSVHCHAALKIKHKMQRALPCSARAAQNRKPLQWLPV